jgi:hypothetical protein
VNQKKLCDILYFLIDLLSDLLYNLYYQELIRRLEMNNYFVYDKDDNLVGRVMADCLMDALDKLGTVYDDETVRSFDLVEDNVSWSDAETIA